MTFCEKTEIAKFANSCPQIKSPSPYFFLAPYFDYLLLQIILYSFNNHHQVPKYFNFTAKFHRFEPVDFQLRVPVHEIFSNVRTGLPFTNPPVCTQLTSQTSENNKSTARNLFLKSTIFGTLKGKTYLEKSRQISYL